MRSVRKHRAPKGALRRRKHALDSVAAAYCQKAPSAKRCIKTKNHSSSGYVVHYVRKHRAPKGALRRRSVVSITFSIMMGQKAPSAKRCIKTTTTCRECNSVEQVRKHRAPKGALRREVGLLFVGERVRQKAPSAKRCIKTRRSRPLSRLRTRSESTERQKVH